MKESRHRLYIRRWLQAPVQHPDGSLEAQRKGTPQGRDISPLLANLFLHYVFDRWVEKHCEGIQFRRYADDTICHCNTEQDARQLLTRLTERFIDCGLTLEDQNRLLQKLETDR